MLTPFELSVTDLINLGQNRAVEFFRRLLWAEAARVGIARNLIDVPDCINVGDGGIDATIENANPSSTDIICQGTNGFQIKSSSLGPQGCRKELHQGKNFSKSIKPEVKRILDKDGTYILVIFADLTTQQKRYDAISDELNKLGYANAKIRIYTVNQLIGFAERFPSLVTWLKGDSGQSLYYESWALKTDINIPRQYIDDDVRSIWKKEISNKLRNPDDKCPIIRITGLSGIGKTRFAFETLSESDLRTRVIYVNADIFIASDLYTRLQNDNNLSAILVIDECGLQQHEQFVRSFAARGSRLAVITLSPEFGNTPPPTLSYQLPPLSNKLIEEIVKAEASALPADIISRLAEFADGYPRIAIILASSYIQNSSERFLRINDDALIDRLVGGRLDCTSDYFRKTEKVLTALSIFQKVGYEGSLSREVQWLAGYSGIIYTEFREIVIAQKQRGIIQGQHYINVTPFMLRIHLFSKWWENREFTADTFNEFIGNIPQEFRGDLLERLFSHLPYITSIEQGRVFTKNILNESGIFFDGKLFRSKLGAMFFEKLAEADPDSALKCLKQTIGTWNKDQLLEFTDGRREIIWALERMSVWRHLFYDSAKLLLALGEAENETYSNNASGVFAGLFSLAPGYLAPTEASPEERIPVIIEALESTSKERRNLGLNACDEALESEHFTRIIGTEYQGLRKEPQLWKPKTYGELFDAYRKVWRTLYEHLDRLVDDEQQRAINILLARSRGLILNPHLADMVIDTIKELINKPYVDKYKVLAQVIKILHYERGRSKPKITKRLERIVKELTGKDYSSRLHRYVGMSLLEDSFNKDGERIDQIEIRIQELAQESIEHTDRLQAELGWLMAIEVVNSLLFGYEIGKRDDGFSLLNGLINTFKTITDKKSTFFLGGYFRAVFENDPELWEKHLDRLARDQNLNILVSELTWRSGMTDRAAKRILKLAKTGVIDIRQFRLFQYGGVINHLSENIFIKWVRFLINSSEVEAISIALSLYNFFYSEKESKYILPRKLTLKLLTHPLLFQKVSAATRDQMDDFNWTEIGKSFTRIYPENSLVLADTMIQHINEKGTLFDSYHSQMLTLLDEITKQYPKEIWKIVTLYLGPPIDTRAYHIKNWLRGGDFTEDSRNSALSYIPIEKIWEWVDADIKKRARYLASFVPNILFREEGKVCLARELLVRYGSQEGIGNSLMANFSTEIWWGNASAHFQEKKQNLLQFKDGENNDNVKSWIDEYVFRLDRDIKSAQIEEEREK